MKRLPEPLVESSCERSSQRRSRGNTKAQLRQGRYVLHFAKRLVENRHSRKDRGVGAGEVIENSARKAIATNDHWNSARNQWRKQIAEPVGMRNGYDRK